MQIYMMRFLDDWWNFTWENNIWIYRMSIDLRGALLSKPTRYAFHSQPSLVCYSCHKLLSYTSWFFINISWQKQYIINEFDSCELIIEIADRVSNHLSIDFLVAAAQYHDHWDTILQAHFEYSLVSPYDAFHREG